MGTTFPNDDARREHYLKLLAVKLKDPEFRKIEGFPIGTDKAILAMSDPPYYTACPNPFLKDFTQLYGKPYDSNSGYAREPLAIDVSVGKTDPIYRAHSYHTKVPHLAIVPSILHYTKPGDIVLDGFCGSGMTGVAAQWCGSAPAAYRHELETAWKKDNKQLPIWGARRVILSDLSPAATFITANYNLPFDIEAFSTAGTKLLKDIDTDIGWMYETLHSDGKTLAKIEYTIWSESLSCRSCAGEMVFTDAALDEETKRVDDVITCSHCGVQASKEQMDLSFESFIDPSTREIQKRPKRVPVKIQYRIGKAKYEKNPDENDLGVLKRILDLPTPSALPMDLLPDCQMTRVGRMKTTNTTATHFMFLPRAAHAMSYLWEKSKAHPDVRIRQMLKFFIEQGIRGMSVLNRYKPIQFGKIGGSQVGLDMPGVFYVPSIISEVSPWAQFEGKLDRLGKTFVTYETRTEFAAVSTGSATATMLPDSSVDYIFTDPPFGENIYYSDLNFLVESWHEVTTDTKPEAIIDRVKRKGVSEYQHLIQKCFNEYYRVLKPGRWMTVVFSNSRAAVWNAIQVALQQEGFVVAEVSALDKVQGSFQQVMSTNAVKQDLVISAYKPNGGLEDRFNRLGATVDSVWDFVQTHLKQLPAVKFTSGDFQELLHIVERDPRRIYDRMVSWFIRHGAMVPISTPEFLSEISVRFAERNGMIFLLDQASEYDKKRQQIPQTREMELFVSDERSAIDWLTNFLKKRPSTYSEIHPEYIPVVGSAKKKGEIIPELAKLLEDNFIQYDGKSDVPSQIHSLLSSNFKDLRGLDKSDPNLINKAKDRWYVPDTNKAIDLEKRREKILLKEFESYVANSARKLKEFRLEVLRAGFKSAWAHKDYASIINVAIKLPEEALQEDEKLLTLYDMALTRTESGG